MERRSHSCYELHTRVLHLRAFHSVSLRGLVVLIHRSTEGVKSHVPWLRVCGNRVSSISTVTQAVFPRKKLGEGEMSIGMRACNK